jgi:hypothetical protein
MNETIAKDDTKGKGSEKVQMLAGMGMNLVEQGKNSELALLPSF